MAENDPVPENDPVAETSHVVETSSDVKPFAAQINRVSMGSWLAATVVAVLLEFAAVLSGVGGNLDWLLLGVFGGIAAILAKLVLDKRPVLIINEEGVLDRRVASGMMRWDDMLWHKLYADSKLPQLAIGLSDAQAKKAGVYPWSFMYRNLPGPFGKTKGYRVWSHRTRSDKDDFVAAIQHFEPSRYDDDE